MIRCFTPVNENLTGRKPVSSDMITPLAPALPPPRGRSGFHGLPVINSPDFRVRYYVHYPEGDITGAGGSSLATPPGASEPDDFTRV